MAMETVLTLAVIVGLPAWLVGEELVHRFIDRRARLKAMAPRAVAGPAARDDRRPVGRASHVA